MRKLRKRVVPLALLALAVTALGLAGTAHATLTKEYVKFKYCPRTNAEVKKCLWANTESGEVKLGSKTVSIENDVLLQGGFGAANAETKISKFFAATEGKPTLAPVSQNVPGGLAGVVPQKGSGWLVERLVKFFFENKITGLGSTLELAGSPTLIEISESNMSRAEGIALKMPVKVRLENPFLGSKCYVGTDASPITWKLTSGVTAPTKPNVPITGASGKITFLEGGRILQLDGNSLVDNNWSAPKASGCGGLLSFLVNPIVNSQLGTTSAGYNTAILNNTVDIATPAAINKNDAENP